MNPDKSGCVLVPTRVFFLTDSHRTLKKSHSGVNYGSLLRVSPRKRSVSPSTESELNAHSFILSKARTLSVEEDKGGIESGWGNHSDGGSLDSIEYQRSRSSSNRSAANGVQGFRTVHCMGAGGRHSVISATTWEDGHAVVYSWGRGDDGQLGVGTLTSCAIPVQVTTLNGFPVDNISCGWAHTGVKHDCSRY